MTKIARFDAATLKRLAAVGSESARLPRHGSPKVSVRPRSYRPQFELLEARCLLSHYTLGPLVQVSQGDPFADCTADDVDHQPGALYPGGDVEPHVAVDPTNPDHIVGIFQQDRWSNGGARGLVAGVSFDGGNTWQDVVIPGLSLCSGGTFQRVSDPWLSFDPNGDLYSSGLVFQAESNYPSGVLVNKSTDGGLTWSAPTEIIVDRDSTIFNDTDTITADPTESRYAYVVWHRRSLPESGYIEPEMFSRTTDGGQTWEEPRVIYDGGVGIYTYDSHILVLPDGTVLNIFTEYSSSTNVQLLAMRSTDKGQTWESPVQVAAMQGVQVTDPDTGQLARTSWYGTLSAAVDPNSGNLYVVWEDARFSGGQYNGIALSMSTGGGFSWSAPVQVNQTPTDIAPADRQAFVPSVQVAGDGTVGVTYYDFRFNDADPGLPTDYWFVHGRLNQAGVLHWGHELRLTDQSFDLETAPYADGLFLGDYASLAASGSRFMPFFAATDASDPADILFRAISRRTAGAPGGAPASLVVPTAGTTADAAGLFDVPVLTSTSIAVSPIPASAESSRAVRLPAGAFRTPVDDGRALRFIAAGDKDNDGLWVLSPSETVVRVWPDDDRIDVLC
jgi:hypothetical protein